MSNGKWIKKLTMGTSHGHDFSVNEGGVAYTEHPEFLEDAVAKGHYKVCDSRKEALEFSAYLTWDELVRRSYKSLNPGVDDQGNPKPAPMSLIDFRTGDVVSIDGVPANLAVYAQEHPAPKVEAKAPAMSKTVEPPASKDESKKAEDEKKTEGVEAGKEQTAPAVEPETPAKGGKKL